MRSVAEQICSLSLYREQMRGIFLAASFKERNAF